MITSTVLRYIVLLIALLFLAAELDTRLGIVTKINSAVGGSPEAAAAPANK